VARGLARGAHRTKVLAEQIREAEKAARKTAFIEAADCLRARIVREGTHFVARSSRSRCALQRPHSVSPLPSPAQA
jgi:hypothetical protein